MIPDLSLPRLEDYNSYPYKKDLQNQPKKYQKSQNKSTTVLKLQYLFPTLISKIILRQFFNPNHLRDTRKLDLSPEKMEYIDFRGISIAIYRYGVKNSKKILCAHGWAENSSVFDRFIETLTLSNYQVILFDMPAHGHSSGENTNLYECADLCEFNGRKFGPLEAIIGHCIGALASFAATAQEIAVKKLILISSPSSVQAMVEEYGKRFGFSKRICKRIINHLEFRFHRPIDSMNTLYFKEKVHVPGLIVHDRNDNFMNFSEAKKIQVHWKNAQLLSTSGLGHRKICADKYVISTVKAFIAT